MVETRRPYRITRQKRLLELLDEAGGPKALALVSGVTDTHLTACAKGRREIGDDMAASLEEGMGKPFAWMDEDGPAALPGWSAQVLEIAKLCQAIPADKLQALHAIVETMAVSRVERTQPQPEPTAAPRTSSAAPPAADRL